MSSWEGKHILEVGDVEVDLDAREIRRAGVTIEVQARVFELFQYLLHHRERVVTKTELLEALWAGQTVVPDVVSTAFYSLRRALRDDAKRPQYIRTVHRVGYQLVANVNVKTKRARPRFPALDLRHMGFVGREEQKALFRDMLTGENPTQLLFVHGLPGIGKTTLLQELAFRCRQEEVAHIWLSNNTTGTSVEAFVGGLARALDCERSFERVCERLSERRPLVIFVDDVHLLKSADEWMRQALWPALPSHVRLVLAGRVAPSARWRCDPAWAMAAHEIELPCFTMEEAHSFLATRGVTVENDSGALWRRAHGLPLALALAVEVLRRDEQRVLGGVFDDADIIDTLVGWFTDQIDVVAHQRVFDLACLFDEVPVRLLAIGGDPQEDADSIKWLSDLSFATREGETIRVHALVREAEIARLVRRDWRRFVDVLEGGQRFFLDELTRAPDSTSRVPILYRFLGQGRHHPALRSDYYTLADLGPECTMEPAASHELPHLLDIVKRHEGRESMAISERWLEHPNTRVWCAHSDADVPAGFLVTLRLRLDDRHEAIAGDPLIASLFDFLSESPARAGGEILINRTLIAAADYQTPSSVMRHIHAAMTDTMLWESPGAAHAFTIYGEPDLWEPVAIAAGFTRLRMHEVSIGERTFAPFHRFVGELTPKAWFTEINERMVTVMRGLTQPASANA